MWYRYIVDDSFTKHKGTIYSDSQINAEKDIRSRFDYIKDMKIEPITNRKDD